MKLNRHMGEKHRACARMWSVTRMLLNHARFHQSSVAQRRQQQASGSQDHRPIDRGRTMDARSGVERAVARASQAYLANEVALDDGHLPENGHLPEEHAVHEPVHHVHASAKSARNMHHVKFKFLHACSGLPDCPECCCCHCEPARLRSNLQNLASGQNVPE